MNTIEIARKLAEFGQIEDAQKAYLLVLNEENGKNPMLELEAASYIFFSKGNEQTAITTFVSLFNRGEFQQEIMNIMMQALYLPNINKQKKTYKENCDRLRRYSYIFRNDFLDFDDLPILFFPYDDKGYIPYYIEENRFGDYINFNNEVISRNFFKDLEKPILADDVYSQYELEYLYDNVRRSEWVAKENHIYLHYTDWAVFCAYLKCLKLKNILREQKIVFLIENEISEYPIDFKKRFGIDYSEYTVRPIGVQEVKKLIWHTQLATHNGGDFFNEIFYGHPNLIAIESLMFDDVKDMIKNIRNEFKEKEYKTKASISLRGIKNPTDSQILIAIFMNAKESNNISESERIVPALIFQPHFKNMVYSIDVQDNKRRWATLYSDQYEDIIKSPIFKGFKYIKTFTPMRRITTSYAASNRFVFDSPIDEMRENRNKKRSLFPDLYAIRLLNRSFMIDWQDRLYKDSVLVRFEDGKLNPKATFTALATFLDIPYTESMTYCSSFMGVNPEGMQGNAIGFDPVTVYKKYEEFANDDERAVMEYCFRDAYEYYGYDFQYYTGEPVDEEWIKEKLDRFTCINKYLEDEWKKALNDNFAIYIPDNDNKLEEELMKEGGMDIETVISEMINKFSNDRFEFIKYLMGGIYFVNKRGQPLHLMPKLELDPELLEQPLYH